ncbi:LysE family transporter [Mycolicibacterium aubagnense]
MLAHLLDVLPAFLVASAILAADKVRNILSRSHIRQRIERAMGAILVALGLGLAADA